MSDTAIAERRETPEWTNDEFTFYMGDIPKEYAPYIEGLPRPIQVTEKARRFWANASNGGSWLEGPGPRDPGLFDKEFSNALLGAACAQLKEMARQQGFNAIFGIHTVSEVFDDLQYDFHGVGFKIDRGAVLVAEGMAYRLNLPPIVKVIK